MIKATDATLLEVLKTSKYVFVDFNATWCGPCKSLKPVLEKIENDYKDIIFVSADVEDCPDAAELHRVMSVPTMVLFKDGETVKELKMVGAMPEAKIRGNLNKLINS